MPIERTKILDFFPQKDAHGREHAAKTADLALSISHLPEYEDLLEAPDRDLIEAAALVHDLGYLGRQPWGSTVQWEHTYAALDQLEEIFPQFSEVERAMITLVVLNHDTTNHCFPAVMGKSEINRFGYPEIYGTTSRTPGVLADWYKITDEVWEQIPRDKLFWILQIVQEADSRLGDVQRTFDFSVLRGVPEAVDFGGTLTIGTPMWQQSALGNCLLAAKRAILDAYTAEGREIAWSMLLAARGFAQGRVGYENVGEVLRRRDIERLVWSKEEFGSRSNSNVRISQAFTHEGTRIYINGLDLIPQVGRYVLKSRLIDMANLTSGTKSNNEFVRSNPNYKILSLIRDSLLRNYAYDLFTETHGIIRVINSGDLSDRFFGIGEYTLMPPLIDSDLVSLKSEAKTWIQLAFDLRIPQIRVLMFD